MSLVNLLRRCERRYADEYRKANLKHGISRQRMEALLAIEANPYCSQTKLCELTGMDRSTISTMLANLAEVGLIWRERGREDQRTHKLLITALGRRELHKAEKISAAAESAMLQHLHANELKGLRVSLQMIANG